MAGMTYSQTPSRTPANAASAPTGKPKKQGLIARAMQLQQPKTRKSK